MSKTTADYQTKLTEWLIERIAQSPDGLSLYYAEWNEGYKNASLKQRVIWVNLFGYELGSDFDPEAPEDLAKLCDWQWESPESFAIPLTRIKDSEDDPNEAFTDYFVSAVKTCAALETVLKDKKSRMIYGAHESDVAFLSGGASANTGKAYYYELHNPETPNLTNDFISDSFGGYDDYIGYSVKTKDGHSFQFKFDYNPSKDDPGSLSFKIGKKKKYPDLLFTYTSFLICSRRLMELFKEATEHIQVFPSQTIPDYFFVLLYEKIDCIYEKYLKPHKFPPPATALKEPYGSYKLIKSIVDKKDVFRANHDYHWLLVSEHFKRKCGELKITGIKWLKREAE